MVLGLGLGRGPSRVVASGVLAEAGGNRPHETPLSEEEHGMRELEDSELGRAFVPRTSPSSILERGENADRISRSAAALLDAD